MKTNYIALLKFILFSRYKTGLQNHRTDTFIPGIYEKVHVYRNMIVKEIMTIRCLSQVTDLFQVERRMIRELVGEGQEAEQICRTEKWIAAYHNPTRQLVQGVSHKICSFSPERGILLFESKEYGKKESFVFDPSVRR